MEPQSKNSVRALVPNIERPSWGSSVECFPLLTGLPVNTLHSSWVNHVLTKCVDSKTDIWPGVDQIHQRPNQLTIQSGIHQLGLRSIASWSWWSWESTWDYTHPSGISSGYHERTSLVLEKHAIPPAIPPCPKNNASSRYLSSQTRKQVITCISLWASPLL